MLVPLCLLALLFPAQAGSPRTHGGGRHRHRPSSGPPSGPGPTPAFKPPLLPAGPLGPRERSLPGGESAGLSAKPIAPEAYVREFLGLLELEHKAERDKSRRELSASQEVREGLGLCVPRLDAVEGGKTRGGWPLAVLTQPGGAQRPFHALSARDLVVLSGPNGERLEGMVDAVAGKALVVALNDPLPTGARGGWRVDKTDSDVTYRRMKAALLELGRAASPEVRGLRDVILGRAEPGRTPLPRLSFRDTGLNEYQQEAVRKGLAARDAAVIHGPPGTGKTTTLAELIYQAAARGERVLASAASNVAVDNILEKLQGSGLRVVRLGHPSRTASALREKTLDAQIEAASEMRGLRGLIARLEQLRLNGGRRVRRRGRGGGEPREEAAIARRIRRVQNEARRRILAGAQVVLATHSSLHEDLGEEPFDLAVMDEASQATEPLSWIPLLQSRRAVFAGDPMQLPPTLHSEEAAARGLGRTMLERLMEVLPETLKTLLRVQYRMHQNIMEFPSRAFYEGRLIAHPSAAGRLASGLEGVRESELTHVPVQFVDTAGAGFREELDSLTQSRLNRGEAGLAARIVTDLLAHGLKPGQIGVITPYAAQERLLKSLLGEDGPEVRTVDGFQGREKEAIVVSLVRSNRRGEVGFLEDLRRLNVALTRARRSLIVIGDSHTLKAHPLYAGFMRYAEEKGVSRSAFEWPEP